MFRLMLVFSTLLILFGAAVSPNDAKSGARAAEIKARTLCAEGERVVWSCEIRGQAKIASVCSSKELEASRGYVQYRFGRAGQIELEFPRERVNTQAAFKYSRYTRPLVTYLALRFENEGATYSISDDFNDEEGRSRRDAAITVKPSGANARERILRCKLPVTGSLTALEDVVQKVDDSQ